MGQQGSFNLNFLFVLKINGKTKVNMETFLNFECELERGPMQIRMKNARPLNANHVMLNGHMAFRTLITIYGLGELIHEVYLHR